MNRQEAMVFRTLQILSLLLLLIVTNSQSLAAAFDNKYDCDQMLNSYLSTANASGGQLDEIIRFENGRAILNKESKRIVALKTDAKHVTVTFNREVLINGKLVKVKETANFTVNDQGYILKYDNDRKNVDASGGPRIYTINATIDKDSAGCSLNQYSTVTADAFGKDQEVVNSDKKFCESVRGVLGKLKKESFEQCHDILKQAADAYVKRSDELKAESKELIQLGPAQMNNFQLTLDALDSCGPDEWYTKVSTGMGTARVLKQTASGPVAASAMESRKKKGVK